MVKHELPNMILPISIGCGARYFPETGQIYTDGREPTKLAYQSNLIFARLVATPGIVVSKFDLAKAGGGAVESDYLSHSDENRVDLTIMRIRDKLTKVNTRLPNNLITVRFRGYCWG